MPARRRRSPPLRAAPIGASIPPDGGGARRMISRLFGFEPARPQFYPRGLNLQVHGLRGLAALLVFVFHIYGMATLAGFWPAAAVESWGFMYFGRHAVELFFIISGYLIAGSVQRHGDARLFLIDRCIRIYPAFLAIHLIVFALGPPLHYKWMSGIAPAAWARAFVENALFLPGLFDLPLAQLNAWSLSYEAGFYLLCAAVWAVGRRLGRGAGWAVLVAATVPLLCLYPKAAYFLDGAAQHVSRLPPRVPVLLVHSRRRMRGLGGLALARAAISRHDQLQLLSVVGARHLPAQAGDRAVSARPLGVVGGGRPVCRARPAAVAGRRASQLRLARGARRPGPAPRGAAAPGSRPCSQGERGMIPRDRAPYSAIVDRPPLRLPGQARLVVWTIVNLEFWDIARPMARQVLPAPTGQVLLPDVPNWSWHEYGMRVGVWRFFDLFARLGIRPTLSINARVCEDYPRVARQARDAGWEFMGHAYEQMPIHRVEDQKAMIERSLSVIEQFTGTRPVGWLGPGLTQTEETPELLAAAGIKYIGDWVYDDEPTEIHTDNGPLVTLPYTVELNDIPMMLVQHHESEYFTRRCLDTFDRLYAEGASRAKVMAIAIHPYISGQPHRIGYLEAVYDRIARYDGVLHWNGVELLDWYLKTRGEG